MSHAYFFKAVIIDVRKIIRIYVSLNRYVVIIQGDDMYDCMISIKFYFK